MPRDGTCVRLGVAAVVAMCLFASYALAAPPAWSLLMSGQDITRTTAFNENTGVPELNVSALAPMVHLRIAVSSNSVTFTSPSGNRWSATAGDFSISGDSGLLQLSVPLRLEGTAVYLPLDALSKIAEIEVSVDQAAHVARINPEGDSTKDADSSKRKEYPPIPSISIVSPAAGWDGFSVPKTEAEKMETARLENRPESTQAMSDRARAMGELREPDQSEALNITTEDSYVYGRDGAMLLTGSGKLAGFDTDFSTFPTFGRLGAQLLSGQFNFGDRKAGWNFSGGDLFSEIWGLARGIRFTDQLSKRDMFSTGMYLQTMSGGKMNPVVSFGNQYDLNGHIALAGELNSDLSFFGRATLTLNHFNGSVFYRDAKITNGNSDGASAGYQLLRHVGVFADYTLMGMGLDRMIMRDAGIRWEIVHQYSLTLTEARTSTEYYKMRMDSALLTLPMNRVRLNMRYQIRDLQYLQAVQSSTTAGSSIRYNQLTPDVSVRINSRALLDEQIITQWSPGVATSTYDQFTATVVASKKLDFNLTSSLIDIRNTSRLLARVQYKFRPTLYLITEYGNVPPYQNVPPVVNPQVPNVGQLQTTTHGLRFTIRKTWRLDTPTRGGTVEGRVLDANHQPIGGAVIEAGPYATQTNENGSFSLRKLPRGEYTVKLREESVPANLYGGANSIEFESVPGRSADISFSLVNLREIHGLVFIDANGNGRPDDGEGVEMVTLKLGDEMTSSMIDGRFGFYNLKPGIYTVKLISASLPKNLVVSSSEEVTVEVAPTGEVPDICFRVEKKKEDIQFVEPPKDYIIAIPNSSAPPLKQSQLSPPFGKGSTP